VTSDSRGYGKQYIVEVSRRPWMNAENEKKQFNFGKATGLFK
jgi:hypothetical protein